MDASLRIGTSRTTEFAAATRINPQVRDSDDAAYSVNQRVAAERRGRTLSLRPRIKVRSFPIFSTLGTIWDN